MGAHGYRYFVPYEANVANALEKLRQREFAAGRYNPVLRYLKFREPEFSKQRPGAEHESIAEAVEDAGEEGTRSILDIESVGTVPAVGTAAPFPREELEDLFGTDRPERDVFENNFEVLMDDIPRGQCFYAVLYEAGSPVEIFFAGKSFD